MVSEDVIRGVIGAPCNGGRVIESSTVTSTFSSSIVTRRAAVDDPARGRNLGTNAMIGVLFLFPELPRRDDSDGNLDDMSAGDKDRDGLLPGLVCGVE